MRKGFTILELLVASLLLGMLLSILTMIFNQSSIAWRTGLAGVSEMNNVRTSVGTVREEADNIFFHAGQQYRIVSPWKMDGSGLRARAYNEDNSDDAAITKLSGVTATQDPTSYTALSFGKSNSGNASKTSYAVGVMSYGPDGVKDTYDDITSWPDTLTE